MIFKWIDIIAIPAYLFMIWEFAHHPDIYVRVLGVACFIIFMVDMYSERNTAKRLRKLEGGQRDGG